MNALNILAAKPTAVHLWLNQRLPFLPYPPPSTDFRRLPPPLPRLFHSSVKSRFKRSNSENQQSLSGGPDEKALPESSLWTAVKAAVVAAITAVAVILLSRHYSSSKPLFTSPTSSGSTGEYTITEEEIENLYTVLSQSDDLEGLRKRKEIESEREKLPDAIETLNKLIDFQPEDTNWPMFKAQLHEYYGQFEIARNLFAELIHKDPLRVEAYHGLVNIASYEKNADDFNFVVKKAEEALELCRKENLAKSFVVFKLLIGDICVFELKLDDALRIYEEVEQVDPSDFGVYQSKGLVYSLFRKYGKAEDSFGKYWKLVPEGHRLAKYFDRDV